MMIRFQQVSEVGMPLGDCLAQVSKPPQCERVNRKTAASMLLAVHRFGGDPLELAVWVALGAAGAGTVLLGLVGFCLAP